MELHNLRMNSTTRGFNVDPPRGILTNETFQSSDCGKVDEDRAEVDVKADLASGNGTASEEDPWDSLHGPSLSSGA